MTCPKGARTGPRQGDWKLARAPGGRSSRKCPPGRTRPPRFLGGTAAKATAPRHRGGLDRRVRSPEEVLEALVETRGRGSKAGAGPRPGSAPAGETGVTESEQRVHSRRTSDGSRAGLTHERSRALRLPPASRPRWAAAGGWPLLSESETWGFHLNSATSLPSWRLLPSSPGCGRRRPWELGRRSEPPR